MKKETFLKLLSVILPILVVAVLGSIFVNLGMGWFNSLNKPSQWIPNIIIPIVWTVVYLSFAVILTIWVYNDSVPTSTIVLLIVNGVLNVLWCLVFFTLKLTFVGNIVIVLNLIFGFYLLFNIKRFSNIFFNILSIYPIWLSIATTLNLAIWILN